MKKALNIYLIVILFISVNLYSYSQVLNPLEIHSEHKCCNKAKHIHKQSGISSYGYDMIFQRIEHFSQPAQTIIKGTVTCFIKAEENIDTIRLDMAESLVIDSVLYHGNNLSFIHFDKVLKIILPSTISTGMIDSVSITYEGPPGSSNAYVNGFHGAISQTIPVVWTNSEPYYSRDWYPCKMTLDDKIDSIDLIISCPVAYRSASNGLIASEIIENGIRTTHWKHRYPIAHYLVAYIVTNFEVNIKYSIMPNGDSLEIHNYVWPEDNGSYPDLPHSLLPEVLEYFNEEFIPYPFANEKYGHARWMGSGAMENQTITFTHNYNIGLLAHELAHHWFGNYVTCGSWQDIWLNESFATFTEGMVHEDFYPEYWLSWKKTRVDFVTSLPGGSVYVYDTTSFYNIFNSRLTYRKGALMLNMLRWEIGEDDFFDGVNNYLNDPDHAHGFAKSDDIISHWEQVADTSLTEFFDDWLYGEGYPIYELSYSQENNLNLELYIHQTVSIETADFFEMHVPVLFQGINEDTLMVFHNLFNGESFEFNPGFEVINIEFDPDYQIISKGSHITRINETEINNGLWVYPNPVLNEFFIEHDIGEISSVTILDLGGKLIESFDMTKFTNSNQRFSVTGLPSGSYFVRIKSDEGVFMSKLIKL